MTYIPGKFNWKKANALNGYSGVKEAMGDFDSELKNTIDKGKGFAKNPFSKINNKIEKPGLYIQVDDVSSIPYTPGKPFEDDGTFKNIVIQSLNYIYENGTSWFKECIDNLSENENTITTIFETAKYGMNKCDKGQEPHVDIDFNYRCALLANTPGINGSKIVPPYISLAHELSHAYRYLLLVKKYKSAIKNGDENLEKSLKTFFNDPPDEKGVEEEAFTTNQEKELCQKLGLGYRNSYLDVRGVTKVNGSFSIEEAERTEKENKEILEFNKGFN